MTRVLQDYFAEKLIGEIQPIAAARQQSQQQALQLALTNLQSLYQHNQLIFQVHACTVLSTMLGQHKPFVQCIVHISVIPMLGLHSQGLTASPIPLEAGLFGNCASIQLQQQQQHSSQHSALGTACFA